MQMPTQTLVVPDGLGQLAVLSVNWRLQHGVDVTIPVRVVHSDGTVFVLEDADQCRLALKERATDSAAALEVDWTIDTKASGLAHWTISRAQIDALGKTIYAVGAQFLKNSTTKEDCVILPGRVIIDPAIASL